MTGSQRLAIGAFSFFSLVSPAAYGQPRTTPGPKNERPKAAETAQEIVENAVVRVSSTLVWPDPYRPWTTQAPTDVSGSGVVIEGNRILTTAHLVYYARQVEVQANRGSGKVPATVVAIAPEVDLAVLKLEDPSLFDSHPPLARVDTLPRVQDTVVTYGYPTGGSGLSVTKGIVSRIEFVGYGFLDMSLPGVSVSALRIQIDAAINPGNSGGPVVVGDKMIGLAFGTLPGATNIGYIIPCEEIDLFLRDIADGRYDGKPVLRDELQPMEDEALRSFLRPTKPFEGMVVRAPYSNETTYPLKKWDVITKIGETPIDGQGMIDLGHNLRVRFQYLVQRLAANGKVPLTIARGEQELRVEVPVASRLPLLISDLRGAYPSYFIYGPLVFSNASMEFLSGFMRSSGGNLSGLIGIVTGPMMRRLFDPPAFDGETLVVVSSPFFPHRLATGYENPIGRVVKSVNGHTIKNLGHLVEALRHLPGEFITIEFEGRGGETLVFRQRAIMEATDEILSANGIRSQGSADMLSIWNDETKSATTESSVTYHYTAHMNQYSAGGKVWVLADEARLEYDVDANSSKPVCIWEAGGKLLVLLNMADRSFFAQKPHLMKVSTLSVNPPFVLVDVDNVLVEFEPSSTQPADSPGSIPCRWWSLKLSYDLRLRRKDAEKEARGRVVGTGDYCLADSLPAIKLPFGHGLEIFSEIPKVDAALAERVSSARGIPIRQSLTVTRHIDGAEAATDHFALELSGFGRVDVPLDRFYVPKDFRYIEPSSTLRRPER